MTARLNTHYDPTPYEHRAEFGLDDGQPIIFNWHLPRGTLSKRMSGYELAWVLGKHLPGLLPLMVDHPRAYNELLVMATMLLTTPREYADRIMPWVRSVTRESEYDVVQLSLFDKTPQPDGKLYFV